MAAVDSEGLRITITAADTIESIDAKFLQAIAMVNRVALARQRAEWRRHPGPHRWRLLVNQPHPETGLPTYKGCEKCGRARA